MRMHAQLHTDLDPAGRAAPFQLLNELVRACNGWRELTLIERLQEDAVAYVSASKHAAHVHERELGTTARALRSVTLPGVSSRASCRLQFLSSQWHTKVGPASCLSTLYWACCRKAANNKQRHDETRSSRIDTIASRAFLSCG